MRNLEERFNKLKSTVSPFKAVPRPKSNETITWLEPELIAEIKFAEWTKDNLLRQASFKGLRTDKNPKNIRKEAIDVGETIKIEAENGKANDSSGGSHKHMNINSKNGLIIEGIKITNPDKVIFEDPKITKFDVVRYYSQVAERMCPSFRIGLSIVRCPRGVSQTCFYKKHPGPGSKGIVTVPILTSDGNTEDYFYLENKSGLIYEAQMGTLELHTWGSRIDTLEKPDMMVFDLDPDEGMELDKVRQGARDIKTILAELSLNSYLKTSGGKGYHVVVP